MLVGETRITKNAFLCIFILSLLLPKTSWAATWTKSVDLGIFLRQRNLIKDIAFAPDDSYFINAESGIYQVSQPGITRDANFSKLNGFTESHDALWAFKDRGLFFYTGESQWEEFIVSGYVYAAAVNPANKYEISWLQSAQPCYVHICGLFTGKYNPETGTFLHRQVTRNIHPTSIVTANNTIWFTTVASASYLKTNELYPTDLDVSHIIRNSETKIYDIAVLNNTLLVFFINERKSDGNHTSIYTLDTATNNWADITPNELRGSDTNYLFTTSKNNKIFVGTTSNVILSWDATSKIWNDLSEGLDTTYWHYAVAIDDQETILIGDTIGRLFERSLKPTPPPYHPVVFIHGWGGKPTDWTSGDKREYTEYLQEIGYPADYIKTYAYADADDDLNTYDYQGDIEKISSELNGLITQLSSLHKQHGGDGKVDLIGFSMGGLVIREYLDHHNAADNISKIITVGTPHLGADIMTIAEWLETIPGIGNYFSHALRTFLDRKLFDTLLNPFKQQPLSLTSTAAYQFTPNSSFLNKINNKQPLPDQGFSFTAICGNIDLQVRHKFLFYTFERNLEIGDGLMSPHNATTVPSAINDSICISDAPIASLKITQGANNIYSYSLDLPTYPDINLYHSNLMTDTRVFSKVIGILTS